MIPQKTNKNKPGTEVNNLVEEIEKADELNPVEERSLISILVVDDEEIMRKLLTDVLADEGYSVRNLSKAEDALVDMSKQGADILITDIKMKGMTGLELLRKTKEVNPTTDVIVMTGYASIDTAVESMKLGAIDYLTKPLNIEHIKLIVNKASEQRSIKRKANESVFYKKLSQLDGLTELFNHRFFQEIVNIEIARAKRENWPLSLIMADLDDFKQFNDRYGHPMGDLALKKVSWIIKNNSRACDFAARYGGEEFAIIIPNAEKETAEIMGNRIRKVIEQTHFGPEEGYNSKKLTMSIGISEYPTDVQTREELIEKADKALYKAKELGKNRVCPYNKSFK